MMFLMSKSAKIMVTTPATGTIQKIPGNTILLSNST